MKSIEEYLIKDEKILWCRSEIANLMYFLQGIIIFIVCSIILLPIINLYILDFIREIDKLFLIIIFIIIDGILIFLAAFNYIKRKNKLKLTYKELRHYKQFNILTNKRFIRRNYYLNYKVDLSRYFFENLIEQIDDIIFLNLENVSGIIIEYHIKEINFLFSSELSLSPFYIKFKEMEPQEFERIIQILTELLNLERVEKYSSYEKLVRRPK